MSLCERVSYLYIIAIGGHVNSLSFLYSNYYIYNTVIFILYNLIEIKILILIFNLQSIGKSEGLRHIHVQKSLSYFF